VFCFSETHKSTATRIFRSESAPLPATVDITDEARSGLYDDGEGLYSARDE